MCMRCVTWSRRHNLGKRNREKGRKGSRSERCTFPTPYFRRNQHTCKSEVKKERGLVSSSCTSSPFQVSHGATLEIESVLFHNVRICNYKVSVLCGVPRCIGAFKVETRRSRGTHTDRSTHRPLHFSPRPSCTQELQQFLQSTTVAFKPPFRNRPVSEQQAHEETPCSDLTRAFAAATECLRRKVCALPLEEETNYDPLVGNTKLISLCVHVRCG